MESTVAALLLVTTTLVLSCIVVVYAVEIVQQSFAGDSPQMELITSIQNSILNQTSINGTLPSLQYDPTPTPTPTPIP